MNSKLCYPAFTLAIFTLSITLVVPISTSHALEFVTLKNYDLPGNDLRTPQTDPKLNNISLDGCLAACFSNAQCSAYTYNAKVRRCYLKRKAATPKAYSGAISGIRPLLQAKVIRNEAKTVQKQKTKAKPVAQALAVKAAEPYKETQKTIATTRPTASSMPATRTQTARYSSEFNTETETHTVKNVTTVVKRLPKRRQPAQQASFATTTKVAVAAAPKPSQTVASTGAIRAEEPAAEKAKPQQVAAIPRPAKPRIHPKFKETTNALKQKLAKHKKLLASATTRFNKHLRKYDREKAGTKWIKVPSLGIDMPMDMTTSQAKALVINKIRDDATLTSLRTQLSKMERSLAAAYERTHPTLPAAKKKKLADLFAKKRSAMKAFLTARKRTHAYGAKLKQQAKENMAMPTDRTLRKLHRLIRTMRRTHTAAVNASKNFANQFEQTVTAVRKEIAAL